jgi:hypothetical protein
LELSLYVWRKPESLLRNEKVIGLFIGLFAGLLLFSIAAISVIFFVLSGYGLSDDPGCSLWPDKKYESVVAFLNTHAPNVENAWLDTSDCDSGGDTDFQIDYSGSAKQMLQGLAAMDECEEIDPQSIDPEGTCEGEYLVGCMIGDTKFKIGFDEEDDGSAVAWLDG